MAYSNAISNDNRLEIFDVHFFLLQTTFCCSTVSEFKLICQEVREQLCKATVNNLFFFVPVFDYPL